ncbi:MAG TPA: vitamin K epoxide reductase family protein [Phycisphaerales bacterium]|nr:vitamin K epoxide reductase family protein [Phycisphaerales bacterium]
MHAPFTLASVRAHRVTVMAGLGAHEDGAIPPGWDYNPASWRQRMPIVVMAVVGFVMAAYLSLYQYRVVSDVWEPFFGEGSRTILDSPLSRAFPVSDAALGALGYLADALAGVIGGVRRWRTMPWMVVIFGVLVGPLGLVSVALVVAQPVLYDSWCTICVATAVISVLMIGPAMDEVLASLQHLRRAREREDRSLWRAFWGMADRRGVPRARAQLGR